MAMELTWSLHYCLTCDNQTQGEAYCSQSCRLTDLESSSSWSGPISPFDSASSSTSRNSGLYLSPAINFAAYRAPEGFGSTSASQNSSPLASYLSNHALEEKTTVSKTVTPSSSRSSLSSTQDTPPQTNQLSQQARTDLLGYTNSFDNVRNWRRSKTWS